MATKKIYILGIESSCDDTSAAVICDGEVLSNIVANQEIHAKYGGSLLVKAWGFIPNQIRPLLEPMLLLTVLEFIKMV